MTNISRHNNLPKDFKIVVPDEIYDDEVNAELPFNKKHVISQSGLKLEQFKKNNKDANVYFAIACLEDITNINIVYDIVRFLKDKYRIDAQKYANIKVTFKSVQKNCHTYDIM